MIAARIVVTTNFHTRALSAKHRTRVKKTSAKPVLGKRTPADVRGEAKPIGNMAWMIIAVLIDSARQGFSRHQITAKALVSAVAHTAHNRTASSDARCAKKACDPRMDGNSATAK